MDIMSFLLNQLIQTRNDTNLEERPSFFVPTFNKSRARLFFEELGWLFWNLDY